MRSGLLCGGRCARRGHSGNSVAGGDCRKTRPWRRSRPRKRRRVSARPRRSALLRRLPKESFPQCRTPRAARLPVQTRRRVEFLREPPRGLPGSGTRPFSLRRGGLDDHRLQQARSRDFSRGAREDPGRPDGVGLRGRFSGAGHGRRPRRRDASRAAGRQKPGRAAALLSRGRGDPQPGRARGDVPVSSGEIRVGGILAAGIDNLAIIFNAREEDCARFVRSRFPGASIEILVKTTASSYESYREITAMFPSGPALISTVDAWCPRADFVEFARKAARAPAEETVLAVTPFVSDEKPLWVRLDASGRITQLGASGNFVTAGLYAFPERVRKLPA